MPNLLCTNDKDCTGIIKGLMYNVCLDGDYAVYNGNRYRADRFEELHKPTPPEVYMDILNLGKVNKVLVNEINNEINKKGGLSTYETEDTKNVLCGRVRNGNMQELDGEKTNVRSWWDKALRFLFNRNASSN